jgi:hypothetical protein
MRRILLGELTSWRELVSDPLAISSSSRAGGRVEAIATATSEWNPYRPQGIQFECGSERRCLGQIGHCACGAYRRLGRVLINPVR